MRRLWMVVLWCLACTPLHAAVTFDSSGSGNSGASLATSVIASITVGANANGFLVVGLCTANGNTDETTAFTFNGDTLTLIDQEGATNDMNSYLFMRKEPDETTANVSFTTSASRRMAAAAISLHGVDQTTPHDAFVMTTNANDTTSVSINVTTATNDMIVDVGCKRDSTEALVMGTQTGRTSREADETTAVTASTDALVGMSTRTGTGSLAMNWTSSTNRGMTVIGINVNETAGAATGRLSLGFKLLK